MFEHSAAKPEMTKLRILVNNVEHFIQVKSDLTLLEFLRNKLGLTGAKRGCASGSCGACTVVVNKKAVPSCRLLMRNLNNAEVITIEGLKSSDRLHPLQIAFMETGAVQCGFCTPGMIMSAYALLVQNPSPDQQDIYNALQNNLCRCTGYQPIEQAVIRAADYINGNAQIRKEPNNAIVGSSIQRIDGIEKVTGQALFTDDIEITGNNLLYGAICFSPITSGRLVSLNLDRAKAVTGVRYVFTAADVPGKNSIGRWKDDRPVFVENKIRFIGDVLALVLADTPEAARTGVQHIESEIVPEPGIYSIESALESTSADIHPHGNKAAQIDIRKSSRFADENDIKFNYSDTFQTTFVEHALLEPETAFAYMEDNCLKLIAPSQNVYFDRLELMRILGIKNRDIHRIRVIEPYSGAAFGKHEDLSVQPFAALGTFLTRLPVKITLSRDDSFRITTKRHPMVISHSSFVNDENKLIKQKIILHADTGAYSSWAPNILRKSAVHATGAYLIPDVEIHGVSVHTNNAFSGAFRGFGAVQTQFAAERHIDRIARQRNLDPVDFRISNALKAGDTTATNQIINNITPVAKLLDAVAKRISWPGKKSRINGKWSTGFGIAAGFYGIGYGNGIPDKGQVILQYHPSGNLVVRTSAIDYGQGARTVFAQLAAEVLNIPVNKIAIITGDTSETPDSGSTVASRQTMVTGNAVVKACMKLKTLIDKSSEITEIITIRTRYLMKSEPLNSSSGQGNVYNAFATAATAAKIRVNLQQGSVELLHIVSAHDSGTIINPVMAKSQVTGGIMMAAGMTLWENYSVNSGIPSNTNFSSYRIPRIKDTPKIDVIFLPTNCPEGPFGAKGIGEPAMIAAGPAILNALCDALDYDFNTIPVTPEMIMRVVQ